MSATPTTTKPGPDQARLRDVLRRLAEVVSPDPALARLEGVAGTLRFRI